MDFTCFELRRSQDDVVYHFDRRQYSDGRIGYKRRDKDVWIIFDARRGWVAYHDGTEDVGGKPWSLLPEEQSPGHPPQGEWVSKKGTKSYVYELVYKDASVLQPIHFGDGPLDPSEIVLETEHFLFLMREQPVLIGSGIIIPKRFMTTPFDLRPEEWVDLQGVLLQARRHIEMLHEPQGYNIGWNVGAAAGQEVDHLHLHIIPRYADEPLAGQGIRYYIKQPENQRPQL